MPTGRECLASYLRDQHGEVLVHRSGQLCQVVPSRRMGYIDGICWPTFQDRGRTHPSPLHNFDSAQVNLSRARLERASADADFNAFPKLSEEALTDLSNSNKGFLRLAILFAIGS